MIRGVATNTRTRAPAKGSRFRRRRHRPLDQRLLPNPGAPPGTVRTLTDGPSSGIARRRGCCSDCGRLVFFSGGSIRGGPPSGSKTTVPEDRQTRVDLGSGCEYKRPVLRLTRVRAPHVAQRCSTASGLRIIDRHSCRPRGRSSRGIGKALVWAPGPWSRRWSARMRRAVSRTCHSPSWSGAMAVRVSVLVCQGSRRGRARAGCRACADRRRSHTIVCR
jgi:hypothetical protein